MNLESILNDYKDRIYRIIFMYAFNHDEQQEMFQLITINLWKSLEKFEGRSSLNTWIYRVAVNSCKMYRRTKFYEKKHSEISEHSSSEHSQEDNYIANENVTILYRCLGKLTDQNRLIMSLYLEELSYDEIASIVGISTNLVGVRIGRCKEKLRECLKGYGIENG